MPSSSSSRREWSRRARHYALTGRLPWLPDIGRPWKVWDLDMEMRYRPVVEALPASDLPICEVGSGPEGVALWTSRQVIGVDPGTDDRHGTKRFAVPNLRRVAGDGAHIPLGDNTVSATLAVDTFEHIPQPERAAVVNEMARVTCDGGRLIIIGPTGPAAADGDRRVLERWHEQGINRDVAAWLAEHMENGLPTVSEMQKLLSLPRVRSVQVRGIYNLELWWTMHRALLGDFFEPRGWHLIHHLTWLPFGQLARHWGRGPYYRYLFVADL